MKIGELLKSLARYASLYYRDAVESIKRNRHMNDLTEQDFFEIGRHEVLIEKVVDATIVDFINFVGAKHGVDFAMYTKNLLEKSKEYKTKKKTEKQK